MKGDPDYVRWYLQSYLAGVPKLVVGYRDDKGAALVLTETTKGVRQRALRREERFDAIRLGRAHGILSKPLEYFRAPERSISGEDEFELRVDEKGGAWITRLENSTQVSQRPLDYGDCVL